MNKKIDKPLKIHWRPHPKQEIALLRDEDEILYGGARGGGKTDAGAIWLIEPKYLKERQYRALCIRRNADDLRDWIDRAQELYAPLKALFVGNPIEIRFPSGAKIRTGHLRDEKAYTKYQGHEYQKMLIEELTQIPRESDYEKLLGSNRSTIPGLKPQCFATTNPDGDGHEWVKLRFDCENPDIKPRFEHDPKTGISKSRIFVPALIEDNPTLVDNDPGYVAFLNNISDPVLRRQWRSGSWEDPLIEGAYYAEIIKEAQIKGRITSIPHDKTILVDTWWDIGISDETAIWFSQTLGKEARFIDYVEFSGWGLDDIIKFLKEKPYQYHIHFVPHDMSVREYSTGRTRLEIAESLGMSWQIVPKIEVQDGINAVRMLFNRCWFDEKACKEGIRALKNYKREYDEKALKFKDRPYHNWASHGADAFRTFAVGYSDYYHVETAKKASEFNRRKKRPRSRFSH